MWIQFLLENAHFAINLFTAFVIFAVFWLYFDAWIERKTLKEGVRVLGYFLLSISFVFSAITIESSVLVSPILNSQLSELLLALTRAPGYLLIIFSLIIDPLLPRPSEKEVTKSAVFASGGTIFALFSTTTYLFPILAVLCGFLYLRRATVGLEDHLKPVALAFFVFSIFELLSLSTYFQNTNSINLYNLVAPFGVIWILGQIILILATIILGHWVFGYLLKRIQTQLFIIFTTTILIIFLFITVAFTSLLLKNIQDESLKQLETNVKVLNLALDSKKAETLSDATMLSQNPQLLQAVGDNSRKVLSDIAENFLLAKKYTSVIILGDSGQVLARGEDRERIGDSLSGDSLVKRALLNEQVSSVVTKDGVMAPQLLTKAAAPLHTGDKTIGVVLIGFAIDNAFVDGIKSATGLEVAIYGNNILSATTFLSSDGKSRSIGIKEEGKNIKEKVLGNGESYTGQVSILNTDYFASYLPLKDFDGNPVGMLFVGKPELTVLQTAGYSIEMTFILAVVLLVLSIFPAFLISKYLSNQIR